jgi:hypothetical protein
MSWIRKDEAPLQGLGGLHACVPRALPVGWYEAGPLVLRTRRWIFVLARKHGGRRK